MHLKHEPLDSITFANDRERWAELEARQLEKNAEYLLTNCIPGWVESGQKGGWHPDSAKTIYEIALKIQAYEAMADQLRRPRYIREENDQHDRLNA